MAHKIIDEHERQRTAARPLLAILAAAWLIFAMALLTRFAGS